ncbi:MAG: pimeloyl-CoA dehydrogenase small subunit [Pelagibacteraceae bacterium]|nr:pimeloyl-CoA dehydrogenase small subunit [Pelagibacteraceae bacterium]|tara:strand:- start:3081 stop:4259 length:1179 start_codon:yes stop_codon:yes gene_type:complete
MHFELSEEQTLLENMVTSFVRDDYNWETREKIVKTEEGWKPENWSKFAELGLLSVPFSENHGGLGGTAVDSMIVMEQFGKGLVVEPFMPSILLSGKLISKLASESQANDIIPKIMEGESRYVFAYAEPQSRFDLSDVKTSAVKDGDSYTVNGFKSVVFGASMATHIIIAARTSGDQRSEDGITLFMADIKSDGITLQTYPTIDEYRASEVVIENLKISSDMILGEVDKAYETIEEVIDLATIAACSEAVGVLQILKDSTVDYCKQRKQFGQPISKNQAIQHKLVDMMIEYEQAKSILYAAVTADLNDTVQRKKSVSAAKARIGQSIKFVGETAIQLHGGMGMVDEYMISHYFKRATMLGVLFGNVDFHLKRFVGLTQSNIEPIGTATIKGGY